MSGQDLALSRPAFAGCMRVPMKKLTLLLSAALLAVSPVAVFAADTANPAATPVPRNDWIARHEGFVERARQGDVDVLFIGDSITDAWRRTGKAIWDERYEPLKAVNFGISGDKTEHLLWRLQNGELDGIAPKLAVLMIGTNNSGRDTAPQIAEGVRAILDEIHQRSPKTKILLLGVFPRGEQPDHPLRLKVAEVTKLIAKFDDGRRVFFLDIGDKFLRPDGVLPASIMPDFLHPNEEGYRIWAEAMDAKFRELLR